MAKLFTESTEHKMLNGTELANRREALGWTQAEFASALGMYDLSKSIDSVYDKVANNCTEEATIKLENLRERLIQSD